MKAELTRENMPTVLANIKRWRAEMKALGMGKHGYFDADGAIHWCDCKPCVKARQAVQGDGQAGAASGEGI